MPFRTIKILPGIDLESSPTLDTTRIAACNLVRFYGGLIQKLGGWAQLSADTLVGVCRGLFGWSDIVGDAFIAAGTDQRLEVLVGGVIDDITPVVATTNPAVQFSTTINTSTVTVHDAGEAPSVGDWINLVTQVSVGGLVLFGYYQVQTIVDGTHYTITAASNATATVVNGGAVPLYGTTNTLATVNVTLNNHGLSAGSLFNAAVSTTVATVVITGLYSVTSVTNANVFVITAGSNANATTTASENAGNARIQYLLPSGFAVDTVSGGYGVGDYGSGDYGLASGGTTIEPLRQWSLDNWGQDLIASPSGGGIYYWVPPTIQPATVMPNAPTKNTAVFVMPQVQIVVSLGAEISGTQEPLLARWSDQGDFTVWTATATNQAGSYFFPTGSMLMGGLAVGLGAVIWTDRDFWSMTYLGFPLVFGFNRISTGCGLISQRAAGTNGNLVMWLSSRHQFFRYDIGGGVRPMECTVWDFYWFNTDQTQLGQYHCAVNSNFNEFAWHFPIATSSPLYNPLAPFGYVKYNYVENCWDYGLSSQYQRTAWTDHSTIGSPVGADLTGLLQAHEVGYDANGTPMVGFWTTGYFALTEGEDYTFIDLLVPDATFDTTGPSAPVLSFQILMTNYPMGLFTSDPITIGPFAVSTAPNGTYFVPFRARARQLALQVSWSDLGSFNRLGAMRLRYAPDGRN